MSGLAGQSAIGSLASWLLAYLFALAWQLESALNRYGLSLDVILPAATGGLVVCGAWWAWKKSRRKA